MLCGAILMRADVSRPERLVVYSVPMPEHGPHNGAATSNAKNFEMGNSSEMLTVLGGHAVSVLGLVLELRE